MYGNELKGAKEKFLFPSDSCGHHMIKACASLTPCINVRTLARCSMIGSTPKPETGETTETLTLKKVETATIPNNSSCC